jgi:hypothetical protein
MMLLFGILLSVIIISDVLVNVAAPTNDGILLVDPKLFESFQSAIVPGCQESPPDRTPSRSQGVNLEKYFYIIIDVLAD